LKPGSAGDATVLSLDDGPFDYVDVVGERLRGNVKINARASIVAGRWWHPTEGARA
jgi:dihydroorotase